MRHFLVCAALLLLWNTGSRAQESDYSAEELQLIKGMLWSQEEIEKEKEAEKITEKQPERKEVNKITEGDTTLKKEGEGWVLEFDNKTPAGGTTEPAATDTTPSSNASGASGVELIVGGQGKDGIAKKRALPVVE